MEQKTFIQVRFKNTTDKGVEFNDALYFPIEDWEKKTQEEIDTLKEERFNNWKQAVENPPAPVEPTKEQLEAEKLQIEEYITNLEAKKGEILASIASKEAKVNG